MAAWLDGLARFSRVIAMDQRGIGVSDRMTQVIDLETRINDVRPVLDTAESEQAVPYGQGLDGGAICSIVAAMYPDRHSRPGARRDRDLVTQALDRQAASA